MFYLWILDLADCSGPQIYPVDSLTVKVTMEGMLIGSNCQPEHFQQFDPEHSLLHPRS